MKNVSCKRLRQTKKSRHQNNNIICKTNITDVRTIFNIGKLHDINRSITISLIHDQTIQTGLFGSYIHKYFIFAISFLDKTQPYWAIYLCTIRICYL